MYPLVELFQFSLDGIPSPRHFNHTTQLLVICKLSVGALDPTVPLMMIWNITGPNEDTAHR